MWFIIILFIPTISIEGVQVLIKVLLYIDDEGLIVNDEMGLQFMIDRLVQVRTNYGT